MLLPASRHLARARYERDLPWEKVIALAVGALAAWVRRSRLPLDAAAVALRIALDEVEDALQEMAIPYADDLLDPAQRYDEREAAVTGQHLDIEEARLERVWFQDDRRRELSEKQKQRFNPSMKGQRNEHG